MYTYVYDNISWKLHAYTTAQDMAFGTVNELKDRVCYVPNTFLVPVSSAHCYSLSFSRSIRALTFRGSRDIPK